MISYEDDPLLKIVPLKEDLLSLYRELIPSRVKVGGMLRLIAESGIRAGLDWALERVIPLSYPVIHLCSSATGSSVSKLGKRVEWEATRQELPWFPGIHERFHAAMVAVYNLVMTYIETPRTVSVWRYIYSNIPRQYVSELVGEAHQVFTIHKLDLPEPEPPPAVLPENSRDYVDRFVRQNVAAAARKFFPYVGRTNLYRIIGPVGEHCDQTPVRSGEPDPGC